MDRLYRINKKCPVCKEEHQYEAHISVRKENEIGYNSSDSVQIGRIPF
jgi:DNA repair exonuclease SbcCD ATPase subunit